MIDFGLLLAVPVLFLVGLKRPDRLLLLWLVLSPLSKDKLAPFGFDLRVVSFDRLAMLASIASLAGRGSLQDLLPLRFSKLEKALTWFLIIFLVEAPVVFEPRFALSTWIRAIDAFVVPFYLYLLTKHLLFQNGTYDDRLERRICVALAMVAFYSGAMALIEAFTRIDLLPVLSREWETTLDRPRVNGPFGPPEVLGEYLSLTLLLTLYRWKVDQWTSFGSRFVKRIASIVYGLVLLGGMYFTMFRNVWCGFLGGYFSRYLHTARGRGLSLLLLGFLGVTAAAGWETIRSSRIYTERLTNAENIYDRLGAWLYSLRAFSEHPLTGIGYGQIKYYIYAAQASGDDLRIMGVPATYHPHNTLIAMLAENGVLLVVPCLMVCWYFLGHVRGCIRLAASDADTEFGLFAVAGTIAMFAPHISDRCLTWDKYNNLLLLFFALVAARHAMLENGDTSSSPERNPNHEASLS